MFLEVKTTGKTFSVTYTQVRFIKAFIETGNLAGACLITGVSPYEGAGWFQNQDFKSFVMEQILEKAKTSTCSFQWWLASMRDIAEGKVNSNKNQMRAFELIAKALGFIKDKSEEVYGESKSKIVYEFCLDPSSADAGSPAPALGAEDGVRLSGQEQDHGLNGRPKIGENLLSPG